MSDKGKPPGFGAFDDLMKKLIRVPKADVDKAIKRQRRKKAKKRAR